MSDRKNIGRHSIRWYVVACCSSRHASRYVEKSTSTTEEKRIWWHDCTRFRAVRLLRVHVFWALSNGDHHFCGGQIENRYERAPHSSGNRSMFVLLLLSPLSPVSLNLTSSPGRSPYGCWFFYPRSRRYPSSPEHNYTIIASGVLQTEAQANWHLHRIGSAQNSSRPSRDCLPLEALVSAIAITPDLPFETISHDNPLLTFLVISTHDSADRFIRLEHCPDWQAVFACLS